MDAVRYVAFYAEDGRITQVTTCPRGAAAWQRCGDFRRVVSGDPVDMERQYVDDGTVRARPATRTAQDRAEIRADGSDAVALSGLPIPCRVAAAGREYDVDDGVFEWATTLPGRYAIRVFAWPHLDWTGEVTAS